MVFGAVVQGAQQARQARRERRAAEESAQARQDEIDAQKQQEVTARVAQARRERGRMIVAQGESGLAASSLSFEDALKQHQADMNKDVQTIRNNAKNAGRSNRAQYQEALAGTATSGEILMSTAAKAAQAGAQYYTPSAS